MLQMDTGNHPFRQQTNNRQVHSAHERQPRQNPVDVVRSIAARPDARNKPAVLPHVVRQLRGIKNNSHVEKGEKDNQRHVDQSVERLAPLDRVRKLGKRRRLGGEKQRQSLRERQQRARENRRNHSAGIDPQRQIRHLPAHHFPPHHPLRVLHRNPALPAFHEYDERHHRQHQRDQQQNRNRGERSPLLRGRLQIQIMYRVRQAHHDARENNQRHPIADAPLADLLAQPHDERRTRGQRQHGHHDEPRPRVIHQRRLPHALARQRFRNRERLEQAQNNRQVARVLRNLPAAQLAFFLQTFQVRPHHYHQLQNDRRRDVRHDPQRENRQPAQIAAAEQIDQPQHRSLALLEQLLQQFRIDARRRNVSAQAIHRQQTQRKQHPVPQVGRAENVPDR